MYKKIPKIQIIRFCIQLFFFILILFALAEFIKGVGGDSSCLHWCSVCSFADGYVLSVHYRSGWGLLVIS